MSDNLDHLINDAFAEFDAAERGSFPPVPGTAAVRRTVAHRRRVRYTMLGALGALLIAVPVAAFAANPRGNNSPPGGGVSASPSDAASPTPSATPSTTPSTATVTPADVRNATLALPAFPDYGSQCPAGTRRFVNGSVPLADQVVLVIGEMAPVMADLDGVPGDEELTTVRCQTGASANATQLLALKVGADGVPTPLGYVVNSPDAPNMAALFDHDAVKVENGVVRLTVYGAYQTNGWPPCNRQVRGYGYRDGAFIQVSGPTSFVKPSKNFHQVDFRNTGLLIGFDNPDGRGGSVYCVPMVDGTGEANIYPGNDRTKAPVHETFTVGPVSFLGTSTGEVTFAIVTYRSPDGATGQTLQSFRQDGDYPLGYEIVKTGTGGVTAIQKAEISGVTVRVTVTVAGGAQVWTYQPAGTDQKWQRAG
jgi:hypothetical protein